MPALENIAPPGALFTDPKDLNYQREGGILQKRFGVVPFSVLDARQGYWQNRKREWVELGIKGEEGRADIPSANNICSEQWGRGAATEDATEWGAQQTGPNSPYRTHGYKKDAGKCFGSGRPGDLQTEFKERNVAEEKGFGFAAAENAALDEKTQRALGVYAATNGAVQERAGGVAGTSVFDPVLCEMIYKWFAKPGGRILDPFAGESTKGIVASFLGYQYTGVELRQGQVDTNNAQALLVQEKVRQRTGEEIPLPTWVQGDSSQLTDVLDEHEPFADGYDFIWTSPPYFDLEIYSKSEKDGSAFETYPKFMAWYKDIFGQAVARLKPNRFVAVKVGEIRDDSASGFYRNFEADNIRVFEELGLHHYNRIVLVTAVGSLPVRIGSQFPKYRKVGNTHQMIYIFWKGPGSTKTIPEELGVLGKENVENHEQQQ